MCFAIIYFVFGLLIVVSTSVVLDRRKSNSHYSRLVARNEVWRAVNKAVIAVALEAKAAYKRKYIIEGVNLAITHLERANVVLILFLLLQLVLDIDRESRYQ
jgi:hypothetical protein